MKIFTPMLSILNDIPFFLHTYLCQLKHPYEAHIITILYHETFPILFIPGRFHPLNS